MSIEQAMNILEHIRFRAERGFIEGLSTPHVEALNLAISALKTVDDMPELITQLIAKEITDDETLLQNNKETR